MQMPDPDPAILARKEAIVAKLKSILPEDAVISDPAEVKVYECDALTAYRCPPLAVVLPASTEEVAAVLRLCHGERVPVVPRGSGTSLAGGALPTADCVVLGVARLTAVPADGDDVWILVPLAKNRVRLAVALHDRGDPVPDEYAPALDMLKHWRDDVHANLWDEELFQTGLRLVAR